MVIHKNKILAFILLIPNIALANVGIPNTNVLYAQAVMWISVFLSIIAILIFIIGFLLLRKNKNNKKIKVFIIIGFIIFAMAAVNYVIASIIKHNIPQTINQGIGAQQYRFAVPCSQRSTAAIPKGGKGINCEADNLCKLLKTASCDTCQDVVWVCVER